MVDDASIIQQKRWNRHALKSALVHFYLDCLLFLFRKSKEESFRGKR